MTTEEFREKLRDLRLTTVFNTKEVRDEKTEKYLV